MDVTQVRWKQRCESRKTLCKGYSPTLAAGGRSIVALKDLEWDGVRLENLGKCCASETASNDEDG